MHRRTGITAILLAVLILSPPAVGHAQRGDEITVGMREGQLFPDYTLRTMRTGELKSLSSFRGKKILLLQFASW
jgi:hypothetical protein